jgi:hypothetical protein
LFPCDGGIKKRDLFGFALCLHYLCKSKKSSRKNGKEAECYSVSNENLK